MGVQPYRWLPEKNKRREISLPQGESESGKKTVAEISYPDYIPDTVLE